MALWLDSSARTLPEPPPFHLIHNPRPGKGFTVTREKDQTLICTHPRVLSNRRVFGPERARWLLPAEDLEGGPEAQDGPGAEEAEARQDVDQRGAFGNYGAEGIGERGERKQADERL